MTEETRPKPSFSGRIYGEIVYWGTILGSVIAIIGSTIAVMVKSNVVEPSYVFSAMWEGKTTATIWKGAIGTLPKGHWYLPNISTGDGLTMFGLALGVFSVTVGLFASSIPLVKNGDYLFAGLAIIAGIISLVAALGLFTLPG
jgi:hypothetical protein